MNDSVFLKVSSAFLVGGKIARVGDIVEVPTVVAKDLLGRGKAVLATGEDAPASQESAAAETEVPAPEAKPKRAKRSK